MGLSLNVCPVKMLTTFLSNHAKAIPAILGAVVFVGIAFLPMIFGQYEKPTLDAKGKIKVEKTTDAKSLDKDHADKKKDDVVEIKALHATADGVVLVGGKNSFHQIQNGGLVAIESFPGRDIKGIASSGRDVIFVASKSGLHRYDGKAWTALHDSEGEAVTLAADGTLFFAPKKMGLLQSKDNGKTWTAVELPGLLIEEKHAKNDKTKDHE